MIYYCITDLNRPGGVQTYIQSIVSSELIDLDCKIVNLLDVERNVHFDFLHINDPRQLSVFQNQCPAVYTLHNHSAYCPSGTKYLASRKMCCSRPMSYWGCMWGHLAEGCGSRRHKRILDGLENGLREIQVLKQKQITTIAVSEYARQQLIHQGLPSQQVITIYHGTKVPNIVFHPLSREIHAGKRILFVGRIVPNKGLEFLLRALHLTDKSIHLDIAGEGWFRPNIELLAKRLKLVDRITWHGWCGQEKLNDLHCQCFTVVVPSVWPEPAGLVTLEAYARFRPVIATAVGGIPEYIWNGKTGILVQPGRLQYFANAIDYLADNFSEALALGENGHEHFIRKFTMEIHIENLKQLYESTRKNFRVQRL